MFIVRSISSRMLSDSVTVTPRYLKFSTFINTHIQNCQSESRRPSIGCHLTNILQKDQLATRTWGVLSSTTQPQWTRYILTSCTSVLTRRDRNLIRGSMIVYPYYSSGYPRPQLWIKALGTSKEVFCSAPLCITLPVLAKLISISNYIISVAVAWSVEYLPSNPAARVRFPARSGNLISVLGLGVCPVLSSAEALTVCWPHIRGGPPLCICLVFCSRNCCSPYRHLTHGHLDCKSLGV